MEDTDGDAEAPGSSTVPLMLVSAYQHEQQCNKVPILPHLPSHRFRWSVWHDLSETDITGDQLKAPRVRYGPSEKEELFYKIKDENNRRIHHARRGHERLNYQKKQENWETVEYANLSYQELGHKYQMDIFIKVLKRLIIAKEVTLLDNGLTDISSVAFPLAEKVILTRNYLSSFKCLPRMPRVKYLNVDQNNIENMEGIGCLRNTSLESLTLHGNPVSFTLNYRQQVFFLLPRLQYLDNLACTDADRQVIPDKNDHSSPDEDKLPPTRKTKLCLVS